MIVRRMGGALLHRLVDELAMWAEDRRRREPVPFRAIDPGALDCFGPLPPLPRPPPRRGAWRAPSPRPAAGDPEMAAVAVPADGAPRGTAILVPPWKAPGLAALRGWQRLLSRAGFDVWTAIPPRHFHRAAPGVRSGEGFVSPDLAAFRATVEQLVLELRVLAALARARGGETALVGLSLGALGAALAATAPEAVDAAALVAPPADLFAVLAQTRLGPRYAALAARGGSPVPARKALAAMLAPFRPDARRPTAGRVLLAAGRHDRIVSPGAAAALGRAWGIEPRLYPRGHLTLLFACAALRRDVARFLAEAAVVGRAARGSFDGRE
jgi:predicted alpha/beta hydrolase family esterase